MATFDTSNIDNLVRLNWPLSVLAGDYFNMTLMTTTGDDDPIVSVHLTHRNDELIDDGTAVLNLETPSLVRTRPGSRGAVRYFDIQGCRFPTQAAGFQWRIAVYLWLAKDHEDGEPTASVEVSVRVNGPRPFGVQINPPEAIPIEDPMRPIMPAADTDTSSTETFGTPFSGLETVRRPVPANVPDPISPGVFSEGGANNELPPPDEILWGDDQYYNGEADNGQEIEDTRGSPKG